MCTNRASKTQGDWQNRTAQAQDLTIGQVARLTGVNPKAIRYYESVGLLPRPPRSTNRYRRYGMADVNRLILLRCIRLLGIPLSAARSLLVGSSHARCVDVQQELLALVDERLTALDHEIAELQQFRAALESYQRTLAACHPDENESFPAWFCGLWKVSILAGEHPVGVWVVLGGVKTLVVVYVGFGGWVSQCCIESAYELPPQGRDLSRPYDHAIAPRHRQGLVA